MRKIFWDEELIAKVNAGALRIVPGKIRKRNNPTVDCPAPYNQEFVIVDPISNNEVARCHQFLEADAVTPSASGFPDPKQIIIGGRDYHLRGKSTPNCEHCASGITTVPVKPHVRLLAK